ncbi:MAG: protein translocase subunit SecF [Frankiales bacterium]|nr:protein translocase subunit SecF [Frankiales bacterium]
MSTPSRFSQARTRLYRGETRIDFIGHRRRWYLASGLLILVCILSFFLRGFNVGIDFKGGTEFQLTKTSATTSQVGDAFAAAGFAPDSSPQEVGSGSSRSIIVTLKELTPTQQSTISKDLISSLHLTESNISITSVSSTWGGEITRKAVQGLIVVLILVFIYVSIRYDWKMAVGALVALLHDLVISAGIYSLVGFELTPSTVVGLLTILGFSLYDTVVVFDKVNENVKDLAANARMTYSEAANLAVNQTLMRSINTSLISLLPVAGLLFVGAGLLGVGTIKDLALILFVGLAVGAYSSLFLATPIVVDLKELEPGNKALTKRVIAKRSAAARAGEPVPAGVGAAAGASATGAGSARASSAPTVSTRKAGQPAPAPRPGARPANRPRKRP